MKAKVKTISKVINICCLSGFLSIATAGTMGEQLNYFDGIYFGGELGGNVFNANNNLSVTPIFDGPLIIFLTLDTFGESSLTYSFTDNNVIGALYAGYGHTWNHWYLGAEIFGNFSKYRSKNFALSNIAGEQITPLGGIVTENNNSFTTELKVSPIQFGIDLRPGFLISPQLLVYGKVGVAHSQVTLTNNMGTNGSFIITVPVAASFPIANENFITQKKDVAALRLGFGSEYSIDSHWSLRMNYTYVYYRDIQLSGSFTSTFLLEPLFFTSLTSQMNQTVNNIHSNLLTVGISYYI